MTTNSIPTKDERPAFVLTLRPTPACTDVVKSLRMVLKFAARGCHLQCIDCAEVRNGERQPLGP